MFTTQRNTHLTIAILLVALCAACGGGSGSDNHTRSDAGVNSDAGITNPNVTGVDLAVSDVNARSCELLLSDPDHAVGEVRFSDAVEGRFVREGDRVAVAFFRKEDGGFAPGAVELQVREDAVAPQVSVSYCFNRDGESLANAHVEISQ